MRWARFCRCFPPVQNDGVAVRIQRAGWVEMNVVAIQSFVFGKRDEVLRKEQQPFSVTDLVHLQDAIIALGWSTRTCVSGSSST